MTAEAWVAIVALLFSILGGVVNWYRSGQATKHAADANRIAKESLEIVRQKSVVNLQVTGGIMGTVTRKDNGAGVSIHSPKVYVRVVNLGRPVFIRGVGLEWRDGERMGDIGVFEKDWFQTGQPYSAAPLEHGQAREYVREMRAEEINEDFCLADRLVVDTQCGARVSTDCQSWAVQSSPEKLGMLDELFRMGKATREAEVKC